jgi:hypothetical protein
MAKMLAVFLRRGGGNWPVALLKSAVRIVAGCIGGFDLFYAPAARAGLRILHRDA